MLDINQYLFFYTIDISPKISIIASKKTKYVGAILYGCP